MKVHRILQGSPSWLHLRKNYYTASAAAEIMGCGYSSRSQAISIALGLKEKKPISSGLQLLFDQGHLMERGARTQYNANQQNPKNHVHPLVGSTVVNDLNLLASFDGITASHDLVWEHKFSYKVFDEIPAIYYYQLEHQLLVADCTAAILTVTSRENGEMIDYHYESIPERRAELIAGWQTWKIDVNFQKYIEEKKTVKKTI